MHENADIPVIPVVENCTNYIFLTFGVIFAEFSERRSTGVYFM